MPLGYRTKFEGGVSVSAQGTTEGEQNRSAESIIRRDGDAAQIPPN